VLAPEREQGGHDEAERHEPEKEAERNAAAISPPPNSRSFCSTSRTTGAPGSVSLFVRIAVSRFASAAVRDRRSLSKRRA
jgi:hypothetical protein